MTTKSVIICNRRTGSNLLKSILDDRFKNIHMINEFFNLTYTVELKDSLLKQIKHKRPKKIYKFLEEKQLEISRRIKLFDIIETPIVIKVIVEHSNYEEIFNYFLEDNKSILYFLERKNKLQQFVSLCIMNASRQAYTVNNNINALNMPTNNEREIKSVNIFPFIVPKYWFDEFVYQVQIYKNIENKFKDRNYIKLYYEELYENMYNQDYKTNFIKIRSEKDKLKLIKNISEVESWFNNVSIE